MSTHVHIYNAKSGLFTGASFHTNQTDPKAIAVFIAEVTPPGHAAYRGYVVDALSQKVDLPTGRLVEYQPPQPSPNHEWNPTIRRWQRAKSTKRSTSLSRIAELEANQHRAVRETVIRACQAVDALREALAPQSTEVHKVVNQMYSAVARLELIDAELQGLRHDL